MTEQRVRFTVDEPIHGFAPIIEELAAEYRGRMRGGKAQHRGERFVNIITVALSSTVERSAVTQSVLLSLI